MLTALVTMVDRAWMVSTITRVIVCQDLLEITVRQVDLCCRYQYCFLFSRLEDCLKTISYLHNVMI